MNRLSLLAISALIAFSGCERPGGGGAMNAAPSGAMPVATTTLKTDNFPAILEARGQTEALNTVQIYARVNGYLSKLHFDEGGFVKKGSPLFSIDPSDLKNALNSAQASYDLAKAAHTKTLADLNRIQPLAEANAASKSDLDSAVAAEASARAQVASAKASLEQARLNLSYTHITAPVDGFVDKRKVDIGTYINPSLNGHLTTIYQNNPIYVNFTFSENDRIAHQEAIAEGKLKTPADNKYKIKLTLADGTTLERNGNIDFVSPVVDNTTGNINYRAKLDNSDNRLVPGQFVKVSVEGMEYVDASFIPQNLLLSGPNGRFVYTINNEGKAMPKVVQTGNWVDGNIIIYSGLDADDTIISDGLAKLMPGMEVVKKENMAKENGDK